MAAGGMGRRRGPTLAERSGRSPGPVDHATFSGDDGPGDSAAGATPPSDTPPGDMARSGPRRRHCWVAGPGDGSGPWPGLVVQWHREDGGWRARVVYVVGEPDSTTTVETWVDAAHLRPA
jgi:hypothetical protein